MLSNAIKHDFAIEKTHATSSVETEPKMKLKHISTSILSTQNMITLVIKHEKYEKAVVKMSNISKQLSPIRTEAAKYAV